LHRSRFALFFTSACFAPLVAVACGSQPRPVASASTSISPSPSISTSTSPSTSPSSDPTPSAIPTASAPSLVASVAPSSTAPTCQQQEAQPFLIRGHYIPAWNAPAEEKKQAAENHKRAIAYRTENYGYVPGFGRPEMNPHHPKHYFVETTFMSLKVTMHERVAPALKCVEAAIKNECTATPYTPRALAGKRDKNTFRGGEITNHMYGIAIDIDPNLNSCCGCVKPWNQSPLCSRPSKTEYDRMAMPECWVHVFEKYGFYWLGHDVLQDTMHFDFLGDPEKIMSK
jgi:hypothetical protein